MEFMKVEYIENKDLQTEIKTFINSPQHLGNEEIPIKSLKYLDLMART